MKKQEIFDTFDLLRFPLCMFVVYEHMTTKYGPVINGEHFDPTKYEVFNYVTVILNAFLTEPVAVPVFFFISGFLFFRGGELDNTAYASKLKRRLKTLLIPYFFWNALCVLQLCLKSLPMFHWENTLNITPLTLLSAFWIYRGELVNAAHPLIIDPNEFYGPILGPLWYLRNLFLLCVFSPLIWWVIKRSRYAVTVIAGFFWFLSILFIKEQWVVVMFESVVFFSWGAALVNQEGNGLASFVENKKICYVATLFFAIISIILGTIGKEEFVPVVKMGMSYFILPSLIALSLSFLRMGARVNKSLAASSLFVYVAHMFVAPPITKIVLTFVPNEYITNITIVPIYLLMILLTVVLLLVCFNMIIRMPSWIQLVVLGKSKK